MPEYQRSRADGSDGSACFVVADDGFRQGAAGVQVGGAWQSAWQHEHLCLQEVNVAEQHVGHDAHAVSAHYGLLACDGYRPHLQRCTTHDVYRCQGLDVLESCGEKNVNHICMVNNYR